MSNYCKNPMSKRFETDVLLSVTFFTYPPVSCVATHRLS